MPRFDQKSYVNPLTNQQVADISNYVLASYGNPDLRVTPADVQQSRDGGPVPLLAKAQPYLVPGGVAVLVVLLLLLLAWRRCAGVGRARRPAVLLRSQHRCGGDRSRLPYALQ